MRDIFVTSDTHFSHANILNFTDSVTGEKVRGDVFSSVEEMDETMIANWNSVVKPGDRVYHLGDVFFGDKDKFKTLWSRLNGRKNLIVGNHDDIRFLSSGAFFRKVQMWRMMPEFNMVLSHVPLHEASLIRHNIIPKLVYWNVHGHTHKHGSPPGNYTSVCVELRNYTPVHIEDLKKEFDDA